MKFLLLGGAGFIGSHLCDKLVKEGHKVRVFERPGTSDRNITHLKEQIEWIEGDFCYPCDVESALTGCDFIVHLVSTTIPKTSNDDPIFDISSNVISTLSLLQSASKIGIKKVLFISSGGTVYGLHQQNPISEDAVTNPICSYGIHKLTIEKYLHLYNHLYGMDYSVIRLANPYGERQLPGSGQGVVPTFIFKILHGEPIEIWGDGLVVRDYVYISDVVDAALNLFRYNGKEKIFNIGSGYGLSLLEVATAVSEVLGSPYHINFSVGRKLDVPINILDITRAKKELNWEPKFSFIDGLKRTISYLEKGKLNYY